MLALLAITVNMSLSPSILTHAYWPLRFQIPTTIITFKEPFSWQQDLILTLTEKIFIIKILNDAFNSSVAYTLNHYLKKFPWAISSRQSNQKAIYSDIITSTSHRHQSPFLKLCQSGSNKPSLIPLSHYYAQASRYQPSWIMGESPLAITVVSSLYFASSLLFPLYLVYSLLLVCFPCSHRKY